MQKSPSWQEILRCTTESLLTTQLHFQALLQANANDLKQKIFLFPDRSGSTVSYTSLPTLSTNLAVFGLNSPISQIAERLNLWHQQCGTDIHHRDQTTPTEGSLSSQWLVSRRLNRPRGRLPASPRG